MFKPNSKSHLCNPLGYIFSRQINDKIDYCKKLMDTRLSSAQNLFRKDLYSHYGCINAIEFSKEGNLLVSGGDDKRVLLWNVEKAIQEHEKPVVMKAQHMSNIFCLGYDNSKSKIFSAGNDDQVIVHDLQTTDVLNFFRHEKPVYGLSIHPYNNNVFSSACDDGRVLIYDIRGSASSAESFFCLAQYKNAFHSVMFNPVEPVMLVTANAKEGISMWDVRKPLKPILRYGSEGPVQSCMNVRFNQTGTTLLALRRRLPPVLYSVNSAKYLCQFYHPGYYNSCTMKSCCFAGNNDEYILSGSDDFNLYMWKIPADDKIRWVDSAHMILRGHRSIVNQVRYNQSNYILASSGVEKIIKLWSPFRLSHKCLGGLKRDDDMGEKQRRVYTHDEYIGLVLRSGQFMTHDYSHQSIEEDQRMMAFFDSLVQREIESWSSEDVPTPQSSSDAENSNTTDPNNASDSDSIGSEDQLMRQFITSTFNSLASSSIVERPLESPNRITRLIANRREKLMRLATLETSSESKSSVCATSLSTMTTVPTPTTITITMSIPSSSTTVVATALSHVAESDSATGSENDGLFHGNKRKRKRIILRSKSVKRKPNCRPVVKDRVRKKLYDTEQERSDIKSDKQLRNHKNYPIDSTQPSTSSGVISTCHSHSIPVSPIKELQSKYLYVNSSSSEDNDKIIRNHIHKHKLMKIDTDCSVKEFQKKKLLGNKLICNNNKASTSSSKYTCSDQCFENERQNMNVKTVSNYLSNKNPITKAIMMRNDLDNKEMLLTPTKNSKHLVTSDSGINSSVSTIDKSNGSSIIEKVESSDCERAIKNLDWFKKKVDVARRGYRKRIMLSLSNSSESSDN